MSSLVHSNVEQQGFVHAIREVARARGLLWDLVSKDLRAQYRHAIMGFVWAVLQPVLMMLILYFVFGVLFQGRVNTQNPDSHPYAVTLLIGLVFWQFFSSSLSSATGSLLRSADLIKKVYFPREVIPLAAMGMCAVNFLIGFVVLLIFHFALGGTPGIGLLGIAPVFAVQLMFMIGLALLCSCLHAYYHDVGYIVEVAITFGFYATPIFYSLADVQSRLADKTLLLTAYMANPMTGIITQYRACLLDNELPSISLMAWPAACAIGVLLLGAHVFRRNARVIADHL